MSRVLVVDDEPGLRQSLGLLLADAGYDVVAEASAARALQRARAEPFDLILCDVRMADMDGIAFLRAYKSGGGHALVIMMSAYGGEEAALAAMKEGAYDYVAKPFRPDEVVLTLRESELFGSVRGAFTGASGDRPGLFEQADGGTLLLDEIGELPLALQAKLLRVLQESEVRRVGDQKTRRVDVRLLAATAKDLAAEAGAGRFRHDLFDRLNVVTIHLPPLAERREGILPLARHFAVQLARRLGHDLALSEAAVAWLREQPWPGNVRALEHAIERAAVLTDKELLEPADFGLPLHPGLPPGVSLTPGASPGSPGTLREAVEAAEREAITAALAAAHGNRRAAAQRLGGGLRTLFYKMDRYGID